MKQVRVFLVTVAAVLLLSCGRDRELADPGERSRLPERVSASGRDSAELRPVDFSVFTIDYYPEGRPETVPAPATRTVLESDEPLRVVAYGPDGALPSEIDRPSVYVLFSEPVVPLAALGRPSVSSDVMTIDPPLTGVYRWYGTRLLSFDSDQEVLPQREYTVTVNPGLRSLGGELITGVRRFVFRTEPLDLRELIIGTGTSYRTDEVPPDEARVITMVFNYPVNLDVLKEYVSVETGETSLDFRLRRPDRSASIVPSDALVRAAVAELSAPPPENAELRVVVREGARSEPGYIGTPHAIERSFHTITPFRYLDHSSSSWTFARSSSGAASPVFVRFSHPVDPATVLDALHTVPATDIRPEQVSVWENEVRLSELPFAPETVFDLVISTELRDRYGRAPEEPVTVTVELPPAQRYAMFPNTGTRMLEAEFPPRIVYEFQNVFDGVWKVGRIDDPYESFDASELEPFDFTGIPENTRHFEVLNLEPWLNEDGKGFVGMSWNFEERDDDGELRSWAQRNLQLQVTDLGITTRIAYNRVIVLVSSLSTGEPVEQATVSLMQDRQLVLQGFTGHTGMIAFDLEPGEYNRLFQDRRNLWRDRLRVRVEKGLDEAEFVPNAGHNPYRSGVYRVESPLEVQRPEMVTLLFTDRGVYRPGETVSYRGIDRNSQLGVYASYSGPYTLQVREARYQGRTLQRSTGTATASGGFYGSFVLPRSLDPGYYVIEYSREGMTSSTTFQVAEFRRLDFTVQVTRPEIKYYQDSMLRFDVSADYLSGGSVAGGSYELAWLKEPAWFRPDEGWEDWSFGPTGTDRRYVLSLREGRLDARGAAVAEQETTLEGDLGRPYRYLLEARVSDVTDQLVSARSSAIVHPAAFYIGARVDSDLGTSWSPFVESGETVHVSYALVEPDGRIAEPQGPEATISAELYRVDWRVVEQQGVYGRVNRRYERVEELVATRTAALDSAEGTLSFKTDVAGAYTVRLSADDAEDRTAVTDLGFYATGADWIRWGGADSGEIILRADKGLYSPGDTAKVLVQSPLPQGTYLITVEREGILEQNVIELTGSAHVVGIPVREEHVPVVYVSISSYSVRSGAPSHTYFDPDLDKPKGYYGVVALSVDPDSRRIELEIDTGGLTYLPGGEAEISVYASRDGRPVSGAEIAFLAVDRGVVDLIDYRIPDPLEFFYSSNRFPLGVTGADSRSLLIDPVTYEVSDLAGGDAEDMKGEADAGVRSDFSPTAVFEPFLVTDAEGRAVVRFTLPDTLTTYRCTALAVLDDRFGFAEDELRVQQPVNVRPDFPRGLRIRDTADVAVVVSNMDRTAREVTVTLSAGRLEVDGEASLTVTVRPGATVRVAFRLPATVPGEHTVTIVTESGDFTDTLVHGITVDRPLVREAFTAAGRTEPTAEEPPAGRAEEGVVIPSSADVEGGELSIVLTASRLAAAAEAINYVLESPYGAFAQRASALGPLLVFGDLLEGIVTVDLQAPDVESAVRAELDHWSQFQLPDGGFPFWPVGRFVSSYYATLRVAHGLALAQSAGYEIPPRIDTDALLEYLQSPARYTARNIYLSLYSLYVRTLLGEDTRSTARETAERGDELGTGGYALLGLIFAEQNMAADADEMLSAVKGFLRLGTRTVDLTETYEAADDPHRFYDSQVEQLSNVLSLVLAVEPDSELVDRLVNTLTGRQRNGRWRNTADTYWALLAFGRLAAYDAELSPDFRAVVKLAGTELLSSSFAGVPGTTVRGSFDFDGPELGELPRDELLAMSLSTTGTGQLYYSATLGYSLPAEMVEALDYGIGLYSRIEDLSGNPVDGMRLTAGRTYRQRVVVSSPRRRAHLVVRAPVPSGAEILDASFVTTATYQELDVEREMDGEPAGGPAYTPSPVRQILDNEIRFIYEDFPQGRSELWFLFRATSTGVYPTPPVQAECVFEPEVYGRSAGRLFLIE